MFQATKAHDTFIINHSNDTSETHESYEADSSSLAYTLTYLFFRDQDGEALADVKASELYEAIAPHLPYQESFDLEDSSLERIINLAICQRAKEFFEEVCGQKLYIEELYSLHNVFSSAPNTQS
ncbi:MAG: hypothetical protein ACRCYY_04995 [Trueperaceae bacterium]